LSAWEIELNATAAKVNWQLKTTYARINEYSNAIVHAFQKFRVLPQLSVNGIETKVLK
jgi:hypothetical protein